MRNKLSRWLFTKDGVLTSHARAVILPVLFLIAAAAVVISIILIILVPKINPASQRGIGANGYQAFLEENSDMGMGTIVDKNDVVNALGDKAKVVSSVDVSKVINLNGDRGQTATYNFVRADGTTASLYIDLMSFKSQTDFDSAQVTTDTLRTGDINGHKAYYMHAQTLSSNREYRLMVIDGLKVYKLVIVQPYRSLTISETAAMAVLKKVAVKAQL
jgi:hypothetical protein